MKSRCYIFLFHISLYTDLGFQTQKRVTQLIFKTIRFILSKNLFTFTKAEIEVAFGPKFDAIEPTHKFLDLTIE